MQIDFVLFLLLSYAESEAKKKWKPNLYYWVNGDVIVVRFNSWKRRTSELKILQILQKKTYTICRYIGTI